MGFFACSVVMSTSVIGGDPDSGGERDQWIGTQKKDITTVETPQSVNARSCTALTDLAEGVGPGRDHQRLGWVQGDGLPDRTSRPVTTNINITTFNACASVSEVHRLQKALLDTEHR